jgi:hypothetical protein
LLAVIAVGSAVAASSDSQACVECHPAQTAAWQKTPMAHSFSRATPDRTSGVFYHQPSQTSFSMVARAGKLVQHREQKGFEGKIDNVEDRPVDYVMGSGAHARTYLSLTKAGALLELPLGWYAEKGGYRAMSPGYDKPDHAYATRKVTYECMFCHNAYPQTSDAGEPLFTGTLPEGIDCARCHGPGSRHIQTARQPGATSAAIRNAIVNPNRLTPERQMETCMQCHLETTSFPFPHSVLKPGRGQFSFQPGEPLSDFISYFDHAGDKDRFQIVSSVYRLRQSQCFLKSGGSLQCTTCHDPHPVKAVKPYNSICADCHTTAFRARVSAGKHTQASDCVGCHMPKRRTDDVVHVVMTDHLIRKKQPGPDLLADRAEPQGSGLVYRGPVLPYYPREAIPPILPDAASVTRTNEDEATILRLQGTQLMKAGDLPAASIALEKSASLDPDEPETAYALGTLWAARPAGARQAESWYRYAIRLNPSHAQSLMNLALVLARQDRTAEAEYYFGAALRVRPNYELAHHNYGLMLQSLGRRLEADRELNWHSQ